MLTCKTRCRRASVRSAGTRIRRQTGGLVSSSVTFRTRSLLTRSVYSMPFHGRLTVASAASEAKSAARRVRLSGTRRETAATGSAREQGWAFRRREEALRRRGNGRAVGAATPWRVEPSECPENAPGGGEDER